jgi:hypothetical protein
MRLVARDVVIHETADPEVIVAEFDYEITGGEGTRPPPTSRCSASATA